MIQHFKRKASYLLSIGSLVVMLLTGFTTPPGSRRLLVGVWESEEKDLQIEMFEENGLFSGRMLYFKCVSDNAMRDYKDVENPDLDLRDRSLLGLKLVTDLDYQGESVWDNGKIYDPNSGNTFTARIELTDPNAAIVRGYWKFRWIGRSMKFHRKTDEIFDRP